ncbi:hypothetical protein B0A49_01625 [Cryomyces minteri]|uniref:Uncharacterized protein n=1 Tax=Cryomyces minteri TaxID=331657 RepID=A0A4U0XW33_9PEZI|nr:hypothetical protein B0A49_01625 [Cryomyces minteri]
MHFSKLLAIAALFATGALAAPAAEAEANTPPKPPTKPTPPPQPTTISQVNACGNNAVPYCCSPSTTFGVTYSSCFALDTTMHALTTSFLLALAAHTLAQNSSTTLSIFLPNTDPQSLVGSIIAVDSTATTLAIACPSGTDPNDCGYPSPFTLTTGPSLYADSTVDPAGPGVFTQSVSCSLGGTTTAVCAASFGGSDANFPGLNTTTLAQSDITLFPVVITAGAEKLGATAAAGAGAVAASTTGASASASASSGASTSAAATASPTAVTAVSTASSSVPSTASSAAAVSSGSASGTAATSVRSSGTSSTKSASATVATASTAEAAALSMGWGVAAVALFGLLSIAA